jgi:hypothetical protein
VSVGVGVGVVSAVMSPVPVAAVSGAGALLSAAAVDVSAVDVSAVVSALSLRLQPAVSETASTSALARMLMVGALDFIGVSWWLS